MGSSCKFYSLYGDIMLKFSFLIAFMVLILQLSCAQTLSQLPPTEQVGAQLPSTAATTAAQAPRQETVLEQHLWEYLISGRLVEEAAAQVKSAGTPPAPDSVAEALLAIIVLEEAAGKVGVPLQDIAMRYNFDILQALNTNPFLNYPRFFATAAKVLSMHVGDSDFHRDLESLLQARLERFRNDIDALETLLTIPGAQSDRTAAHVEQEINTDLFRSGDNTLLEAESLATQGEYQSAIKKIATISKESPLLQIAQEKLIEISNKAVHDLRKRAALAFQKAGPITDRNTRAAYLNEAKTYLEQALTLYPKAENLHTVRSNLVIIARDLEKLRADMP